MCDLAQMNSQIGNSSSHSASAVFASASRTAARKNAIAFFGAKLVQTGAQPLAPAIKACKLVDSHPAIRVMRGPRSARNALMRDKSPVLSLMQPTLSSSAMRLRKSGFMSTPVVQGLL
jgi:hypothetical protein